MFNRLWKCYLWCCSRRHQRFYRPLGGTELYYINFFLSRSM